MTNGIRRYGPNTALVERYLDRLQALEFDHLTQVVTAWRDALRRTDAWYAAEDAVGDAIAALRRHDEQWRLQGRLYEIFRRSKWFRDGHPASEVSGTEAASQYLASTAAFALLVADRLTRAQLATLYTPFNTAIPLASLGLEGVAPGFERGREAPGP